MQLGGYEKLYFPRRNSPSRAVCNTRSFDPQTLYFGDDTMAFAYNNGRGRQRNLNLLRLVPVTRRRKSLGLGFTGTPDRCQGSRRQQRRAAAHLREEGDVPEEILQQKFFFHADTTTEERAGNKEAITLEKRNASEIEGGIFLRGGWW